MADEILTPCNVACGSGIITVNSRSGSTLQCDTWLWDDMPLNSLKRPPYWNSTSDFDCDHSTAVDMSFCTSLWHCYSNRTTLRRKKWRHVDFQDGGSQPYHILWVQSKPLHTYTQAWKQASGDPSGVCWNYSGITLLYKFWTPCYIMVL